MGAHANTHSKEWNNLSFSATKKTQNQTQNISIYYMAVRQTYNTCLILHINRALGFNIVLFCAVEKQPFHAPLTITSISQDPGDLHTRHNQVMKVIEKLKLSSHRAKIVLLSTM